MKEALCQAFCGDLKLTDVPVGYAVTTTFRRDDGDSVAFYLVRDPTRPDIYRIEDDGTTIPFLEASGVELSTDTRSNAFQSLLESHDVEFDEDEMLLHTASLNQSELPKAAMRFLSFMLRINDFLLLTKDKVVSTFKEDAVNQILDRLEGKATIDLDKPVGRHLSDTIPDMVIRANNRPPVALFFGTSAQRVNDAIFLQMQALYEVKEAVQVIALLERENVIGHDLRRRAANRLAALPIYRGDETTAINRIEREAIGSTLGAVH
ncbi:hypothetical protein Sj15T_03350 [Sphingobium sp. TA15]|uniref:DUF1828 domain-containing protein n=1 Tax=Sphingobium indicum (strain DSM 16413 / CCM 7287 / MTCC 6362 / UT26 / NBRC 101211 / UT26S) TaxID=452662 RepID=D4Z070_SPHIU|nr:DUF1828 domain-containing protein [Sphingobium indicum]BAI96002.1 hypothetical protein SJA_C1-11680 [Sphingobium indicum UT26S]BDD65314.1 hypothetical protein Sj15T_03350 [Sphingobium sp. TA15]